MNDLADERYMKENVSPLIEVLVESVLTERPTDVRRCLLTVLKNLKVGNAPTTKVKNMI